MTEYANSFDDLRGDIIGVLESMRDQHALQTKLDEAMAREIDRLWIDNATLRDEVHALANRVEALTRAVTADPAEVAAKIIQLRPGVFVCNPDESGGVNDAD